MADIRDNTVENVNDGHPNDLSKVAVIDMFSASKGPKRVAAPLYGGHHNGKSEGTVC